MQPIYIELSDEITTVIERMKASDSKKIALVIPRGAILLQSIVNLKLTKKAAADAKKDLVLVTTDPIGKNLAAQVGIPLVAKLDGVDTVDEKPTEADGEPHVIAGVKIHRYYENAEDEKADDIDAETPPSVEPIIPREILQNKQAEAIEALNDDFSPIVVRPINHEPSKKTTLVEVIHPRVTALSKTTIIPINPKPIKTPRRYGRRIAFGLLLILFLVGLAAAGVGAFYLPQTDVTIHLLPQPYSKDVTVIAKPGATPSTSDGSLTINAENFNVQELTTIQFTSTGSKDIGNVAKGSATIYNSYSGTPQLLPAGSQLKANGLYFTTDTAVTIPGATVQAGQPVAGYTTVAVTAVASGPDSNLSTVTGSVIAPGTTLYCQIVSTSGGDSKKLQVVTQTDIANAKVDLLKKLRDDLDKKLADTTKARTLLSTANSTDFALNTFTPSVPAGTEAAGGQVTGSATLHQIAVDKASVETAVRTYVTSQQDTLHTLTLSSVTNKSIGLGTGTYTIQVSTTGSVTSSVDLDSIKSQLVGRSKDGGIKLVHLIVKDVTAVDVHQKPDWWPNQNFPFSNKYLTVHLSHE